MISMNKLSKLKLKDTSRRTPPNQSSSVKAMWTNQPSDPSWKLAMAFLKE
jgi:hypothetical protein